MRELSGKAGHIQDTTLLFSLQHRWNNFSAQHSHWHRIYDDIFADFVFAGFFESLKNIDPDIIDEQGDIQVLNLLMDPVKKPNIE